MKVCVETEKQALSAIDKCLAYHRKVALAKKYRCPLCHEMGCYVIDGKFECPNCETYGLDPNKVFKRK